MKKDPLVYIAHMLANIALVETYARNLTFQQFMNSVHEQDSIMRRIEIIGEAAKNVPESFRKLHPDIPWRSICGMRDKLIHEYFSVDLELTWGVVTKEIPKLKSKLLAIKTSDRGEV